MTTNDILLFWTRLLHLQGFDIAHVQQDKELRQNKFSKSGIDDSLWIVP
jgi:hypothetical protein